MHAQWSLFLLGAFFWTIVDNMSSPPADQDHLQKEEQDWRTWAIGRLWEERERIGHTPLIKYPVRGLPFLQLYLKDESATPTRSLKHRFAWALALWSVVEGLVTRNSSTYESSSGNTAAAEAYMYSAIGIPFYAVVSRNLEQAKIDNILGNNGQLIKTDDSTRGQLAKETAARTGGFYVDQHGNAEKAEDFTESGGYGHESGNVFHEVLAQLRDDPEIPRKAVDYFVHCAGTGGTITSVGRYVDRYNLPTKVVLVDTEFSVYYDYVLKNGHKIETSPTPSTPPGVPGVGYPAEAAPAIFGNTTSLASAVIDEVMKIPDIATAAGFREFHARGLRGGPSSAMNMLGALEIALKNAKSRREISIVTLLNDPAEFYQNDYFNDTWINTAFADCGGLKALDCWRRVIASTLDRGTPFIENGMKDCKSN
ncbi:unnamed protein product, partial [Mesorhabditis belari]|uniref:Tryptophan synthase beta chain-like PALP domain-containing protein n=1 Tax=Mesorhabditis belari TaxID=2138241 RepID=A0AAF3J340_9BILA